MQTEGRSPADHDVPYEIISGATRTCENDDFSGRREAPHESFRGRKSGRSGSVNRERSHRTLRYASRTAGKKDFLYAGSRVAAHENCPHSRSS
jgi:hypothetical protein